MDIRGWIEIAVFVFGQIVSLAIISYNRGKADAASIGRFEANVVRINAVEEVNKELKTEVKTIRTALMENSIMMARIDERTQQMVSANRRIEDKLDAMKVT